MNTLSILALSFLLATGLIPASVQSVVEPRPIPNAVQGSVVLADLLVGMDGSVLHASVVHGYNPFSDETLRAVKSWRFSPATAAGRRIDSHVSILTIFRPPALGNYGLGGPTLGYPGVAPGAFDHPPFPQFVSDPGYPVNSVGQGTVMLEVSIDRSGAISGIRVIRDVPGLTELTINAVGNWAFYPAVQSGERVHGKLVVAVVYVRPV